MSTLRKFLALGTTLSLSLTLAACSGGADSGASGSAGGDSGNTLTVWAWDPAFNIYAMEEAAKVYQKDHPDFQLNVVEVPWDDLQAKITTLAQSQQLSDLPDIFLMQNNAFQKNVINYPELFSDFKDTPVDFSQFPTSVVDYSVIDGINYGIPFDSGTAITALRTDILAEAGLSVQDFTDITWDQFIEKGTIVKEKTGKPMFATTAGSSDLIMMMMQSAGASLFDKDGNPVIADNNVLLKAAETYKKLIDSGVVIEVNSWDESISAFVNGAQPEPSTASGSLPRSRPPRIKPESGLSPTFPPSLALTAQPTTPQMAAHPGQSARTPTAILPLTSSTPPSQVPLISTTRSCRPQELSPTGFPQASPMPTQHPTTSSEARPSTLMSLASVRRCRPTIPACTTTKGATPSQPH